jgi:hypothetical protein
MNARDVARQEVLEREPLGDGALVALQPGGVGANRLERLLDGALGGRARMRSKERLDVARRLVARKAVRRIRHDARQQEAGVAKAFVELGPVRFEPAPRMLATAARTRPYHVEQILCIYGRRCS